MPDQAQVDAFLPPYEPRQVLDPDDPVSIGAMVGPEAFEEVRYLAHLRQLDALDRIPAIAEEFADAFGRDSGGLVRRYRTEDADTIVVALGSVLGTIKDAGGHSPRSRASGSAWSASRRSGPSRPRPCARRSARPRVRSWSWSRRPSASVSAGCSSTDVAMAIAGRGRPRWRTVVAGPGGRPITEMSLQPSLSRRPTAASSGR